MIYDLQNVPFPLLSFNPIASSLTLLRSLHVWTNIGKLIHPKRNWNLHLSWLFSHHFFNQDRLHPTQFSFLPTIVWHWWGLPESETVRWRKERVICAFFCVKDGTGRTKVIDFWMQVGRIEEELNLKNLRVREEEKKRKKKRKIFTLFTIRKKGRRLDKLRNHITHEWVK